jgi:hypothetical protein
MFRGDQIHHARERRSETENGPHLDRRGGYLRRFDVGALKPPTTG